MKHTFAISAYGESPFLEACIASLLAQTATPSVIICTSTPNGLIESLAEKYGIRLFVREGPSSLQADWNFAAETAVRETGAKYVTIAHQDDLYHSDYLKVLSAAARKYPDMSLFCTRYRVVDENGEPAGSGAEGVKRLLRFPLRFRRFSGRRFVKRLPLIFGNGICCPSCTYNTELTGLPVFHSSRRFVIDWEALLEISEKPGRFICVEKELLDYRVHDGAETKRNIENHNREREEAEVFSHIWPAPVTSLLMHFYKKAYKYYDADAV